MPALSRRAFVGSSLALAAVARARAPAAPGHVRLSANENPYGPSPAALAAIREASSLAWRYPDEAADGLRADLARLHGVSPDWILLGDGSSEVLKLAVAAFAGPGRALVMAEPSFEACGKHAEAAGAPVRRVPLDASFAHDLARMGSFPDAGLVYICNPNNPTASITPGVRGFVDSASSAVLVDEAYHHYADDPAYESVAALMKTQPRLIVTRTFSKVYGLAGARLGYAIAQPAVISRLAEHAAWDSVNIFALAAGRASLASPEWVEQGSKRNAATRAHVVGVLSRRGFAVIPSQANFFMVDVRRPVKPLIAALAARGVEVGRLFPALPTHLRVTVGLPDQMERFLAEFAAVTS